MGYAQYNFDDGFGARGYAVDDVCNHPECDEEIDRGMAYLCYGCTKYFCPKHLMAAYSSDGNTVIEFDCFAGVSSQCCQQCETEAKNENQ
jgi:hypothetical protein